jgi:chitinase
LYNRSDESGDQAQFNVDWAVNYWLAGGMAANKIVLGLATYGRSFTLAISSNNQPGSAATGPGVQGPVRKRIIYKFGNCNLFTRFFDFKYTVEAGFLSYYEICQNLNQGYFYAWQAQQLVPYIYSKNIWVGYDNIQSLNYKV